MELSLPNQTTLLHHNEEASDIHLKGKILDRNPDHSPSLGITGASTLTLGSDSQGAHDSNTSVSDAIFKDSLTYLNTFQDGEDMMFMSMASNIDNNALEHQTLFSTMKAIPLELDRLQEELSYYQEKLLKRYSVKLSDLVWLETLGKGSFGEVTRVFNKTDRQFYALKEIKLENFMKMVYYENAVWNEIQNLLKVSQANDQSLLRTILIDFDETREVCYLLMELGNGTLEEYSECKKKYNLSWTEPELEYILSQLIKQVLKLKELGMYHRDIKPSNIIICRKENCLKLSDLGCACICEEGVQKLNITGTPHFMSPEIVQVILKKMMVVEHDPFLSDLYSIGITILTLLDSSLKRKDFRDYVEDIVKEYYPNIYPILRDLIGGPDRRKEALEKVALLRPTIQNYEQMENVNIGGRYKLFMYLKIVSKNKNLDPSFYFDMFILDDAILIIQKQIWLINQKLKPGELSLDEVTWRIRQARCYYLKRQYEQALQELETIMQRNELKSYEIPNLLTKAEALFWLGIVKAKLLRVEEAIDNLMHCIGIRVTELGEIHQEVTAVFWHLGDIYLTQDNCSGARRAFEKCIAIGEKLDPKERKYMAIAYNSLGFMSERIEETGKAMELFEKAKETAIQACGEHHPVVADQFLSIAHTYAVLGRGEEAEELCERALDIKKKWYGENNPEVAAAYAKVARVYDERGEYKKIIELLRKSVNIWKAVGGEECEELADVYQLIGNAACKEGQYEKGLKYATKMIKIKEKHIKSGNPRLAQDYVWHAEICHTLGQESERTLSLEKFTAIEIEKLHQSVGCVRMLLTVSKLLCEEGKIEKAWEYAQKGFKMIQSLSIPKVSNTCSYYYEVVGNLRRAEGKLEQALESVREAFTLRSMIKCKHYHEAARLCTLLADVQEDMGNYEEALRCREKCNETIEKNLSKESFLMLKALIVLAGTLKKLGRDKETKAKLKEAKILFQKLEIHKNHPLAKVYEEMKESLNLQKSIEAIN